MPVPKSLGFLTVPAPGTPVVFSSLPLLVGKARVHARSAPGVQNVGNVYIGSAGMNKTTGAGVYRVLGPEDSEVLENTDLGQWWVDADTVGDGIVIGFIAP